MMEMMWYNVIWCTWCDMIWKEIMWYGMTWCYMLWYGVDWNDVIWCSVFRLSHVILLRCPPRSLPSFPTPACPASSNDEGKIAMICRCCFHNLCKCLLQKPRFCWMAIVEHLILHLAKKNIYIYYNVFGWHRHCSLGSLVDIQRIIPENFWVHPPPLMPGCPLPGHYAHHGSKQH